MQLKGILENSRFPSPSPLPSSTALPDFHLLLRICGGAHMWFGSSETTSLRMKTENAEPRRSVELTWRVFAIRKNRCCLSQEEMSVHSKPCFRKPLCFTTLGASNPFNFVFWIPAMGGPLSCSRWLEIGKPGSYPLHQAAFPREDSPNYVAPKKRR